MYHHTRQVIRCAKQAGQLVAGPRAPFCSSSTRSLTTTSHFRSRSPSATTTSACLPQHKHSSSRLNIASIQRYSYSSLSSSTPSPKEQATGAGIEQPPTSFNPKLSIETTPQTPSENIKSIEQVIAELSQDTRTAESGAYTNPDDSSSSSSSLPPPLPPKQKKPSRFWFYLYYILLYSALGSLPVHLLLTRGETKELREKAEWKISILTDMRDKLLRGESIEEEEALLSVGMDRGHREAQQKVDDAYFEDLLKSAEKLDYSFGSNQIADQVPALTPAPVSTPVPAPPVVPRKPAPPKTEKSYL